MTTPDHTTIHRAALAPLDRDYLSLRSLRMADWIERNAPGAFVRLYVVDAQNPHVLVPAARWAAQQGDVWAIEAEIGEQSR